MIRLHNVRKVFSNGFVALDNIQLYIAKEEFIFLVGSNGAGKSTLLKLLYRELKPTQGDVLVDKINVSKLPNYKIPFLRRNIGIVFQDYKLLPKRSVYENVAFALQVIGASKTQINKQVIQVLELVGLADKLHSFPHQISGGEQQKVCIARAIVNNPPILLADEPTGNLAPDTSWEIVQLLNRINLRHTTVVVATHDHTIVDSMRKRVVTLHTGKIIRDQKLGNYQDAF